MEVVPIGCRSDLWPDSLFPLPHRRPDTNCLCVVLVVLLGIFADAYEDDVSGYQGRQPLVSWRHWVTLTYPWRGKGIFEAASSAIFGSKRSHLETHVWPVVFSSLRNFKTDHHQKKGTL